MSNTKFFFIHVTVDICYTEYKFCDSRDYSEEVFIPMSEEIQKILDNKRYFTAVDDGCYEVKKRNDRDMIEEILLLHLDIDVMVRNIEIMNNPGRGTGKDLWDDFINLEILYMKSNTPDERVITEADFKKSILP